MATVCSVLKYFGEAVIGVTNDKDRRLALQRIDQLAPWGRRYLHVVQLMPKLPSHLPNQLLHWGQVHMKRHNCGIPSGSRALRHSFPRKGYFDESQTSSLWPYHICAQRKFNSYGNDRFHVVAHDIATVHAADGEMASNASEAASHQVDSQESSIVSETPYHMVYFTESDQIVYFEDEVALKALTIASNDTTFFVGRRKTKNHKSDPKAYMSHLDSWRQCGTPGFAFGWPKDPVVHKQRDR